MRLTVQAPTCTQVGTSVTLQACCQIEAVDAIGEVGCAPVALVGIQVHAVLARQAHRGGVT